MPLQLKSICVALFSIVIIVDEEMFSKPNELSMLAMESTAISLNGNPIYTSIIFPKGSVIIINENGIIELIQDLVFVYNPNNPKTYKKPANAEIIFMSKIILEYSHKTMEIITIIKGSILKL